MVSVEGTRCINEVEGHFISVMVSKSCMPMSCYGGDKYVDISVIWHEEGKCPKIAVDTKCAKVIERFTRLYWGKTAKSAGQMKLKEVKESYGM